MSPDSVSEARSDALTQPSERSVFYTLKNSLLPLAPVLLIWLLLLVSRTLGPSTGVAISKRQVVDIVWITVPWAMAWKVYTSVNSTPPKPTLKVSHADARAQSSSALAAHKGRVLRAVRSRLYSPSPRPPQGDISRRSRCSRKWGLARRLAQPGHLSRALLLRVCGPPGRLGRRRRRYRGRKQDREWPCHTGHGWRREVGWCFITS